MAITRDPGFIENHNNLKPGDIIIFRAPKEVGVVQRGIMFMQSLVGQVHGHYDSTHAAVCTGINPNGEPLIGHLTGHEVMGYKQEPLRDMIQRDGGDRAYIVYRPTNEAAAQQIAAIAGNEEKNKDIKWKVPAAMGAFVRSAALSPDRNMPREKNLSPDSFCSKFVIQVMKAANLQRNNYYPNIRSSSTPKTLEAYLFNNSGYEMLVHPGKTDPYQLMKEEIQNQINRLSTDTNPRVIDKCNQLREKLKEISTQLDHQEPQLNALQKAMQLLKATAPILKINTGLNLTHATSYKKVRDKAREMGIFERDIEGPEDLKNIQTRPRR